MTTNKNLLAIGALVLVCASSASADAPAYGKLVMKSPNAARVRYKDACSNGANIVKATRDAFVKAMLANPQSKIGQLKATVQKGLVAQYEQLMDGEGFFLDDEFQSYHDRDGCASNHNSYSYVAYSVAGGNTDHRITHALVTIDDDDESGLRTLKLRSITPMKVRDEKF